MKKVVLSLLACGALATANAQGILVFGDVGYNAHTEGHENSFGGASVTGETKTSNFSFNPGIGYMINEHMAVGVEVRGTGTRVMHTSNVPGVKDQTDRGFDLTVGPFFRYTMPINKTFFTYTHLSVGYKMGTFKYEAPMQDFTDEYNGFGAQLYPAIGANVTPRMALAFSIGGISYDRYKWDIEQPNTTPAGVEEHKTYSNFNLNVGQQMNLTIQWKFGGMSKARGNRAPGDDYRNMPIDREDRRRSNDDE